MEYVHIKRAKYQSANSLETLPVKKVLDALKEKQIDINVATHDLKQEISKLIEKHQNNDGSKPLDSLDIWHALKAHVEKFKDILKLMTFRESQFYVTVQDFSKKGCIRIAEKLWPDSEFDFQDKNLRVDKLRKKIDILLREEITKNGGTFIYTKWYVSWLQMHNLRVSQTKTPQERLD